MERNVLAKQVVRLQGRLDASTGNAVLHELLAALSPGATVVADLSAVEAVDAAGVEILATARRQARALAGSLHLSGTLVHPLLASSLNAGRDTA